MSVEGCIGAYVNPAGVVFETVTVKNAQGLFIWGPFSEQDSWFPGFS